MRQLSACLASLLTPGLSSALNLAPQMHALLHSVLLYLCVLIGFGVCLVMLYTVIIKHREASMQSKQFHQCLMVELLWSLVPILIVAAIIIPMMLEVINSHK